MKNIFYYSIAFLVSIFGYTSDANFDRTVEVISVPWTITANFETGTLGEKANGSDGFSGAFGNTIYSNTQANSGSQSAEVGIKVGETGFGQWGGSFNFPSVLGEGDEVWFRTYLYFPDGFPFITDSGFLKTMRIHTRTATGGSGSHEGYHDVLIGNNGTHIVVGSEITSDWFKNNPNWKKNGEPTTTGKWQALEHYIKFSSVPGQGITRVWQNGVLIKEDIVTKTLRSSTSVSDFTYLFTYWNGGAPSNVKAYVDDVIITSQAPANRDTAGNPFIGN